MEEYNKDAWCEIIERCQDAGVDAFELNFSCPHGLPERKMGAAMGQDPDILEEVCGWVMGVAKIPVWAKMTPNVTHIEEPDRAALRAGCHGISAINTIRSVMGVNLETLRPEPTVEGYTTPGGYSSKAVKPIALRMVMEIAQLINKEFPGRTLSGIGGVETGADAAQFILLGCDTVQVCTGVMKFGYGMAKDCAKSCSRSWKAKASKPSAISKATASTTSPPTPTSSPSNSPARPTKPPPRNAPPWSRATPSGTATISSNSPTPSRARKSSWSIPAPDRAGSFQLPLTLKRNPAHSRHIANRPGDGFRKGHHAFPFVAKMQSDLTMVFPKILFDVDPLHLHS